MAKEWVAYCKDCGKEFIYSDYSLQQDESRGFSRPERCPECRKARAAEVANSGIGYFPIRIVGHGPIRPGFLGAVTHDPQRHKVQERPSKTEEYEFGIKVTDILDLYHAFDEEGFRIAVVEGPTGSGKSTFLPYCLMEPPAGVRDPKLFTRDGQIVVTQPRQLPTNEIGGFIAKDLHGSSLGIGADVGYRYSGEGKTDRRNRLVFLTDGTLLNWIKNEQLNNISTIVLDEAHERSLNIDLIIALLRNRLLIFPKLKLIIASATIKAQDFIEFFGGPEKVKPLSFSGRIFDVEKIYPPAELINYNSLLKLPSKQIDETVSSLISKETLHLVKQVTSGGIELKGDILAFLHSENSVNLAVERLSKGLAIEGIKEVQVFPLYRNLSKAEQNRALEKKSISIANEIVSRILRYPRNGIYCGVLLDAKNVNNASKNLIEALEKLKENPKQFIPNFEIRKIHTDLSDEEIERTLVTPQTSGSILVFLTEYKTLAKVRSKWPNAQVVEDMRVIISTNVAETSLTVDGVVHVVDSGLIKQNEYDVNTRTQKLISKCHSQAGCLQRKGRAGRIRPGFAHFLYTEDQFTSFEKYTPPEIERSSLEDIVLKAKAAGVGDIQDFHWFQTTEKVRDELNNSVNALIMKGALDTEGDITDKGLEMLAMTMDAAASSFLLTADQYCCAIEAATILPFLTLNQSVFSNLLLWDRNWDSQTKWEIRQRQKGLWKDCEDDFEFILRVFSAWENSGPENESRSAWAQTMYINHSFIVDILLKERKKLLELLNIGTKGDFFRPVEIELLPRLRFVAACSLSDQVGQGGIDLVAQDSICARNVPPAFIFLKRIMYKVTHTNELLVQCGLLASINPEWIKMVNKNASFDPSHLFASRDLIQRNDNGTPEFSKYSRYLSTVQYPIGSEYEIRGDEQGSSTSPVFIHSPRKIREVFSRHSKHANEEFQLEEQIETETKIEEEKTTPTSTSKEQSSDEEGEWLESGYRPPTTDIAFRIFSIPNQKWDLVDVSSDKGFEFLNIPLEEGQSDRLFLPVGYHQLSVRFHSSLDPQISVSNGVVLIAESDKNYILFFSHNDESSLTDSYILRDTIPDLKVNSVSLRWIHLGWKGLPIELWIDGRPIRPAGYYLIKPNQQSRVQIFRKDDKTKNKQPLAEHTIDLPAGHDCTLIIQRTSKIPLLVNFQVKHKSIHVSAEEKQRSLPPVQFVVNEDNQLTQTGERKTFQISDYEITDEATLIHLSTLDQEEAFERFVSSHSIGDRITTKPVDFDAYANSKDNSLIVCDGLSGLQIAVPVREIYFDSFTSVSPLSELINKPELEFDINAVDKHRHRINLTRLDILVEILDELVERFKNQTVIVPARIIGIENVKTPKGLNVLAQINDEESIPGLIWEEGLHRATTKPLSEFGVGETLITRLSFTGAHVFLPRLNEELIAGIESCQIYKDLRISHEKSQTKMRLNRRMTGEELSELAGVNDDGSFQWAVYELFRRSNQPRMDLVDEAHVKEIEDKYTTGTLIHGVKVTKVTDRSVEVMVAPAVYGSINRAEWDNTDIRSLIGKTNLGDRMDVVVKSINPVGDLSLSRIQASMLAYHVDVRYRAEVVYVAEEFLIIRLDQSESGEPIPQPLQAKIWKKSTTFNWLGDGWEVPLNQRYRLGDRVRVRLEKVNGPILNATICRAYQGLCEIPVTHEKQLFTKLIGLKGSIKMEIQKLTSCEIIIVDELRKLNNLYIRLSAEDESQVNAAMKRISQKINVAKYLGLIKVNPSSNVNMEVHAEVGEIDGPNAS